MNSKLLTYFILITFTLSGCISTNRLTTKNYRHAITSARVTTPFMHTLYNNSDTTSLLFFDVDLNELKYKRKGRNYRASYIISFQVYSDITSNNIVDSLTMHYTDSTNFGKFIHSKNQILLKTPTKHSFINITFKDKNLNKSASYFHQLDRTGLSSYDFLIKNSNKEIIFDPMQRLYHIYQFTYRDSQKPVTAAHLSSEKLQPAMPPFFPSANQEIIEFSNERLIADGILNVSAQKYLISLHNTSGGLPFLIFDEDYPEITDPKKRIAALRYISTNEEFQKLRYSKDPVKAMEDFWDKNINDLNRVYEKMEAYFYQVTLANKYFTTIKEGWKTDRGMIYIIFGAPKILLKYENQEKWIYGEEGSANSLTFVFTRKECGDGLSDLYLDREESYRIPWYKRIENWKK